MIWIRMGIGAAGGAAIVSALLAVSAITLLMTDPATLAAAVDHATPAAVVRALAATLLDAFRHLLGYL